MSFTFGCWGGGGDHDPTIPVSGTVTLDGMPLADATVSFIPENGRPANGTTDADGRFELTTYEKGDGVAISKHKVTVSKPAPFDPKDPYAERPSLVPAKYGDLKTTPLEFTVTEEGFDNLKIEIAE
ncbi:MAG: carboxypeptidase-like regulatory domain-containing protein [Planctomycetales bacterium]